MTCVRARVIRWLWATSAAVACVAAVPTSRAAEEKKEKPRPAEIKIDGLGLWENRAQRASLNRLLGEERGPSMDANAIEDAVFLLVSALTEQGYLDPQVKVTVHPDTGDELRTFDFDSRLTTVLPRPLSGRKVDFDIRRGVRSTVNDVHFTGLELMGLEEATAFFKPADSLWQSPATRAYSPARLRSAVDNFQDALRLLGYADATVRASVEKTAPDGKTDLRVEVAEGSQSWVRKLTVTGFEGTEVKFDPTRWADRAWTLLWQQDVNEAIRNAAVQKGYPDVTISFARQAAPVEGRTLPLTVVATVKPGERVRLREVRFEGNDHTQESVLKRRVRLTPEEPLNLLAVERSRMRLSALGVFSRVSTDYEPDTGPERSVIFKLTELPRWETSLLFGYGSYEQFRGGIEWRQANLFGRAHQSRLLLVQSMKSTRADYQYTVPELFGETLDGTARVFGLRREEASFIREEYGTNVALRRRLGRGMEGRIGYTYQALRNQDNELTTREVDDRLVKVGSVEAGVTQDRRDNPLRPRRGYRWFSQIEAASKGLGGEVDYQIYEIGASYHTAWGRGRWLHFGLAHGAITTFGSENDRNLPVNKRFFPGGESNMRGYQRGEAAPRGADGRFVGAKSHVTLNAELEQSLTGNWSAVCFFDAVGTAVSLADYPMSEELYAIGLGVRYQTLVGPVRVEYGRNLRPREGDPSGTLHFSVGFPF